MNQEDSAAYVARAAIRSASTSSLEAVDFESKMRELGRLIDPGTAEVYCEYGSMLDPYGLHPPRDDDNWGRNWFARNPGSEDWVWFGDLPHATRLALRERGGRPVRDVRLTPEQMQAIDSIKLLRPTR